MYHYTLRTDDTETLPSGSTIFSEQCWRIRLSWLRIKRYYLTVVLAVQKYDVRHLQVLTLECHWYSIFCMQKWMPSGNEQVRLESKSPSNSRYLTSRYCYIVPIVNSSYSMLWTLLPFSFLWAITYLDRIFCAFRPSWRRFQATRKETAWFLMRPSFNDISSLRGSIFPRRLLRFVRGILQIFREMALINSVGCSTIAVCTWKSYANVSTVAVCGRWGIYAEIVMRDSSHVM
jgi:hypothetical protein